MKLALLGALVCASLLPATAHAVSPWDGAWRLNLSKSHYEGSTFTYTKKADGMWNVSNGTNINFDFGTDGKPYPTIGPDDTTTTTMENDHSWTYTDEHKGKVTRKTHEEISADGKTMTEHSESFRPAGGTTVTDSTYTRVSGTTGFAGTWKSTKVSSNHAENFTVSSGSDGGMGWTFPEQEMYFSTHLDGAAEDIHGPNYGDGWTFTANKVSAHEFSYKVAYNNKVLEEGTMALSTDGKTITDTSWSSGKESEKSISVYGKQ